MSEESIPQRVRRWRKPWDLPREKLCAGCGTVKAAAHFTIKKYVTPAGTHVQHLKKLCKSCVNLKNRKTGPRKTNSNARLANLPAKCNKCEQTKGPDQFAKRLTNGKHKVLVLASYCKPCVRKISREWVKNNPESAKQHSARSWAKTDKAKAREYQAKHFQANKEKIRLRNKAFRDANPEKFRLRYLAAIYKRRAFGCDKRKSEVKAEIAYALESYRVGGMYWDVYDSVLIEIPTVDHIVPVSLGGTNTADNFAVTSSRNNSSKNKTSLLLWMLRRRQKQDADRVNARRDREGAVLAVAQSYLSNVARNGVAQSS